MNFVKVKLITNKQYLISHKLIDRLDVRLLNGKIIKCKTIYWWKNHNLHYEPFLNYPNPSWITIFSSNGEAIYSLNQKIDLDINNPNRSIERLKALSLLK